MPDPVYPEGDREFAILWGMGKWIELKCVVRDEMEEALRVFAEGQKWAFFTRIWPEKRVSELLVYFKRRAQAEKAKVLFLSFIQESKKWGLRPGKPRCRIVQKDEESWFRKSKEEFVPKKISRHFVVKPTWESYEPRAWEHVIEIDPQMAFGTGHHFTTRFCLQMLDKWGEEAQTVLDMGCGTGILSIASVKFGATKVEGFDNDPLAIKTAKHNAKANQTKVKFQTLDLIQYQPKKANLVFANIISGVLIRFQNKIFASVKKGGLLFVTGVTRDEGKRFLKQFHSKKFQLVDQKQSSLWNGFVFRRV